MGMGKSRGYTGPATPGVVAPPMATPYYGGQGQYYGGGMGGMGHPGAMTNWNAPMGGQAYLAQPMLPVAPVVYPQPNYGYGGGGHGHGGGGLGYGGGGLGYGGGVYPGGFQSGYGGGMGYGGGLGGMGGPNQWQKSDFSRAISENVSQAPMMQQMQQPQVIPQPVLQAIPVIMQQAPMAPPPPVFQFQAPSAPCPPMPPAPPAPPCPPCPPPPFPPCPMQQMPQQQQPPLQTYSTSYVPLTQPQYVQQWSVPYETQFAPTMSQPVSFPAPLQQQTAPVARSFTLDYGRTSYTPWLTGNRRYY